VSDTCVRHSQRIHTCVRIATARSCPDDSEYVRRLGDKFLWARCVIESSVTRVASPPYSRRMRPPGESRAATIQPTTRFSESRADRLSAHAIRHADDGLGPIHDLQAHGPTTVPLPGSPRCARRGLAPQRTGCMEPDTLSDIALIRTGSTLESIGFAATQGPVRRQPTAAGETVSWMA
jgi:hypothetical protein